MMRTALLIAGICLLTACKKDKTEEPEPPVEVKRTVEYFVTDTDGQYQLRYRAADGDLINGLHEGNVHVTEYFAPGDTAFMTVGTPTGRITIKVEGLEALVDSVPPLMLARIVP